MKKIYLLMAFIFIIVSSFGELSVSAATIKNVKKAGYYISTTATRKAGVFTKENKLIAKKYYKGYVTFVKSKSKRNYYIKLTSVKFSGECLAEVLKTTKKYDSKLKVTKSTVKKNAEVMISGLRHKGAKSYFKVGTYYLDANDIFIYNFVKPTPEPTDPPEPPSTPEPTETYNATDGTGGNPTYPPGYTPTARPTPSYSDFSKLESSHNYADNFDYTWVYTHSANPVNALLVTFDDKTNVESGNDFIYISDDEGNNIPGSPFTGNELANKTIGIVGNGFSIELVSNASSTDYGFKVTNVVSTNNICNLTYNTNGGVNIPVSRVIVGSNLFLPKNITRSDNTFLGWYRDISLNTQANASNVIAGDITVYAKWLFNYTYNIINENEVEVTGYLGDDVQILVPTLIDGKVVTSIGASAFASVSASKIVIPSTVTNIGDNAFSSCENLIRVDIPESVVAIGTSISENSTKCILYVIAGSAAETYAKKNKISYRSLPAA